MGSTLSELTIRLRSARVHQRALDLARGHRRADFVQQLKHALAGLVALALKAIAY